MFATKVGLSRLVPKWAVRVVGLAALSEVEAYLCLHRVGPIKAPDLPEANTSIEPAALDELLQYLGAEKPTTNSRRLVATFDDGYSDAVSYAESRYERFPGVEWMFFVCPAKARDRVGFRWDAANARVECSRPNLIKEESQRNALEGLADQQHCRLATVEELRQLATLPRVTLGNHTNCHFAMSSLSAEDARSELAQSRIDFETLFGHSEHFAFPFGYPGKHFFNEHISMVASEGYRYIYTTESRPYHRASDTGIQVIPRFAVMCDWPAKTNALRMTRGGLRARLRNYR